MCYSLGTVYVTVCCVPVGWGTDKNLICEACCAKCLLAQMLCIPSSMLHECLGHGPYVSPCAGTTFEPHRDLSTRLSAGRRSATPGSTMSMNVRATPGPPHAWLRHVSVIMGPDTAWTCPKTVNLATESQLSVSALWLLCRCTCDTRACTRAFLLPLACNACSPQLPVQARSRLCQKPGARRRSTAWPRWAARGSSTACTAAPRLRAAQSRWRAAVAAAAAACPASSPAAPLLTYLT